MDCLGNANIKIPSRTVREAMNKWWLMKYKNAAQQVIFQCLPSVLVWELWKARCKLKFEGERTSIPRICSQFCFLLKILPKQFSGLAFSGTWEQFCWSIEKANTTIDVKKLVWGKPLPGMPKLNTDGCNKDNPGSAGCGGLLRDQSACWVMTFCAGLGSVSNNIAECQGVLIGLRWCVQHSFNIVLVESDSSNTIKMIKRELKPPWQIGHLIEEIRLLLEEGHFEFQHCFREANVGEDLMANLEEKKQQKKFFTSALNLPCQVKAALKNDQNGIPMFRIRPKKGHICTNDRD